MNPKVSIITPSFNKHEYVLNAFKSVIGQEFTDWEYWILENSNDEKTRNVVRNFVIPLDDKRIRYHEINFSDEDRKIRYPTTVLLNEYYPKLNGEYILYLSDDDILYPNCLSSIIPFMEQNKYDVAWFSQKITVPDVTDWSVFVPHTEMRSNENRGFGTGLQVDCMLDGGQMIHKKSCLDKIEKPYYPEEYSELTGHCDGVFMEKIAQHYTFYNYAPDVFLAEHRRTVKSEFVKPYYV